MGKGWNPGSIESNSSIPSRSNGAALDLWHVPILCLSFPMGKMGPDLKGRFCSCGSLSCSNLKESKGILKQVTITIWKGEINSFLSCPSLGYFQLQAHSTFPWQRQIATGKSLPLTDYTRQVRCQEHRHPHSCQVPGCRADDYILQIVLSVDDRIPLGVRMTEHAS